MQLGGSKRSGISKWVWGARVWPMRNLASNIFWRRDDRLAVDQAVRVDFRRVSLLLTVFRCCQYCVHDCVIRWQRKVVRWDWVGARYFAALGNVRACFAAWSILSLPFVPMWLGISQMKMISLGVLVRVWSNKCIRCTSGRFEWMFWMACRDDRESELSLIHISEPTRPY